MEWMLLPLKRYADFSGRSRRKEYWMFFLLNLIVAVVLNILLGGAILSGNDGGALGGVGALVIILYALATFIPGLAVTVRRFHDQEKSGWMVLLALVPLIGGLILIVFMCMEGTRGSNRYGPDPKSGDGAPLVV
jgi:uncharacterized membrane protein YhaH (DUF805 family)